LLSPFLTRSGLFDHQHSLGCLVISCLQPVQINSARKVLDIPVYGMGTGDLNSPSKAFYQLPGNVVNIQFYRRRLGQLVAEFRPVLDRIGVNIGQ
jgi:hypothetical protein